MEDVTADSAVKSGSDFGARLLVAIPVAAITIFFITVGGVFFSLFAVCIGLVCLHEFYRLVSSLHPVRIAGFVVLIALVIVAGSRSGDVLAVTMASIPLTFVLALARRRRSGVTLSIAVTLLGIFWICLAVAHAVLLRDLPHGDGIIIDLLIGASLGDTAAYFGGRLFGRHKLAPMISPNKTIEGLIAGFLGAVLATLFAGLYQDWLSSTDALLLGLAVAVFAPIGDLFESLVKREARVKDSGVIFGAHGGALDRIDAILFALVAGYYVWVAIL